MIVGLGINDVRFSQSFPSKDKVGGGCADHALEGFVGTHIKVCFDGREMKTYVRAPTISIVPSQSICQGFFVDIVHERVNDASKKGVAVLLFKRGEVFVFLLEFFHLLNKWAIVLKAFNDCCEVGVLSGHCISPCLGGQLFACRYTE